ncbi:MAG: hypothetical protein ABSC48_15885 [Terracidiphilus sp.]|jgi:hypothetical protein
MSSKHLKPGADKPHPQPHENGAQHNQCKWDGDARVSGEINVQFAKDLIDQYRAKQKQDDSHNNKTRLINSLTLVAVIIYASLTAWLVCLSRDNLHTTKEFFQRDQRPYIFATKIDDAILSQTGPPDFLEKRLAGHIWYYNFGKSPALHVRKEGWIFYGSDALKQADGWFTQVGGKGDLQAQVSNFVETVLMQGEDPVNTIVLSQSTPPSVQVQYVVAMRIRYQDTFGNQYWSDVCFWHVPDMAPGYSTRCVSHNEIH